MLAVLHWISGGSRSGKTYALVREFAQWVQQDSPVIPRERSLLFLTDTMEGRQAIETEIQAQLGSGYRPYIATPMGFMQEEVELFWPLLVEANAVAPHLPLHLKPETELMWAQRLWQPWLQNNTFAVLGDNREQLRGADRATRHLLDIFQLCAFARLSLDDLPQLIWDHQLEIPSETVGAIVTALKQWQRWCTAHSLLTYGITTDLFGRVLLDHPRYQASLKQRFQCLLADNTHNYPAVMADLITRLNQPGIKIVLSHQPISAVRLGLGADPDAFLPLQNQATVTELSHFPETIFGKTDLRVAIQERLSTPQLTLPENITAIQTTSRMQLLQEVVETIATAVQQGVVQPTEIAILAPGLDSIARYVLRSELEKRRVPLVILNEQRPLIQSPHVRALLTLLLFVYPRTGIIPEATAVAEMLTVLLPREIDVVRAGLLSYYCFQPGLEQAELLPYTHYSHWDRFGYRATEAYEKLRHWLSTLDSSQPPVYLLEAAIQRYLWPQNLTAGELAPLRSLLEGTAAYWQIYDHLPEQQATPTAERLREWIYLLRRGTLTADPAPPLRQPQGVLLATTFQYRSAQLAHRWHFWLDAGSPRWQDGGLQCLWQAPMFLRQGLASPSARVWQLESERLEHLLVDLCSRVSDRLFLCHSDLTANGREQEGPLSPWVDLAVGDRP
ncbi:putative cyanobacterial membrane protein in cluster with PxcA [Thermosynechococcus sp. NK55a]|nr:putative cyanobacterial membrane protein in cluster with PxcA [Thermosynechococcus sp. NK55a]